MNMLLTSYYHGGGMVDGLTHMIVGSIINGLIFGLIFRLISHLSMMQLVVLVAVVIGAAFLWARSRDQRRW